MQLLIRPTDGNYIRFHTMFEMESLGHESCELWGNNGIKTQKILFGQVLLWNNITTINVKMF